MVGILVQIKGASCVAFVCVKSGKVVSSTLIIKKKKLQRFGNAAFIKVATERRMGGVSLKYLSSLSMRNKGEKKRKKERKKEKKRKETAIPW